MYISTKIFFTNLFFTILQQSSNLKGFLHRKLNFDMLLSIKKYEEMYHTLWCKNSPNKSYSHLKT